MAEGQTLPVTEFDEAVVNAMMKIIGDQSHPELNKKFNDGLQKSATSRFRSESRGVSKERRRQRRSRMRSRSRSRRSRSRSHSHRSDRQRSSSCPRRSRSYSPVQRSRANKSQRDSKKFRELLSTYQKSKFTSSNLRYDVNKTQLDFNEQMIFDIHNIAKVLPSHSSDSLKGLFAMKESLLQRQENIFIADKYGLEIAGLVDELMKALPISKMKQKKVDKFLLTHGTRSLPQQQPFRVQRGGQPRESVKSGPIPGPFTARSDGAPCYKCGGYGHWARACTRGYGAGAFSRNSNGNSSNTKPLFGTNSN